MTDGSRIHVFIGAPTITLIPPQGICGNTVCNEEGHFYEEHRVHLQCSRPCEHTLCRSGQSLSEPSCYVGGGVAAGQPSSLTGIGDTWPPQKVGASSPRNVCEHVTSTKLRPEASLHCDFLELSVSENHQGSNAEVSHGNYTTSTDAEFLAVLASTQVAVQGHVSITEVYQLLKIKPSLCLCSALQGNMPLEQMWVIISFYIQLVKAELKAKRFIFGRFLNTSIEDTYTPFLLRQFFSFDNCAVGYTVTM